MNKNIGSKWIVKMNHLLTELRALDLGYPIENNIIAPACANIDTDSMEKFIKSKMSIAGLIAFYTKCDGISLPDVNNGYFIKSLDKFLLGLSEKSEEPLFVNGECEGNIAIIGSTGGGHRFAIKTDSGCVIKLGNGLVENRVFYGTSQNISVVADSWDIFLTRLVSDVEAFVHNIEDHIYIA